MARRKEAQKLDELRKLCETHTGLEEILGGPNRSEGITEILKKDMEAIELNMIKTAKEWTEIKNNNNKPRGGPTT